MNAANAEPGRQADRIPGVFFWLGSALLVAGVLTVFGPALCGEFLIWDDNISIYENPYLGGLSWGRVLWAFQDSSQAFHFMPLSWLGYSAIFSAVGLDPAGFHAAPLLLHAINAVLLLGILRRQLQIIQPGVDSGWRDLGAWFASALWVFHPLRVEVVAWALTLTYELAWCSLLLAWGCLLRAVATGRTGWLWATVAIYMLSLLTYPVGISAWLAFFILGTWLVGHGGPHLIPRWRTKLLMLAVPGVLVTGYALWIRWHATGPWAGPPELGRFGILDRAAQAAYAWAYYIWRPWFPDRLAPIYDTLLRIDPLAGRFLFSGAVVVAGSLLTWFGRKKWPGLGAWWWATAALAVPVMGLTDHPFFTSDRYTGLPGLALAALLAGLWSQVGYRPGRWLLAGIASGLLAACVVLTSHQVPRWNNTVRLFNYVAAITADPIVRAECHLRLALVAEANGDFAAARHEGEQGLALAPYHRSLHALSDRLNAPPAPGSGAAATQLKLARFALSQNDAGAAEAHFRRAIRLAPDLREPRIRLALLLLAQGAPREALAHFLWSGGSGSPELDRRFFTEAENVAVREGDPALARAMHQRLTPPAVRTQE